MMEFLTNFYHFRLIGIPTKTFEKSSKLFGKKIMWRISFQGSKFRARFRSNSIRVHFWDFFVWLNPLDSVAQKIPCVDHILLTNNLWHISLVRKYVEKKMFPAGNLWQIYVKVTNYISNSEQNYIRESQWWKYRKDNHTKMYANGIRPQTCAEVAVQFYLYFLIFLKKNLYFSNVFIK